MSQYIFFYSLYYQFYTVVFSVLPIMVELLIQLLMELTDFCKLMASNININKEQNTSSVITEVYEPLDKQSAILLVVLMDILKSTEHVCVSLLYCKSRYTVRKITATQKPGLLHSDRREKVSLIASNLSFLSISNL